MVGPMRSAKQRTWLKIGVWPAGLSALLPVVVALFHLMPATMPAMAVTPTAHQPSSHHEQPHHGAASDNLAAIAVEDCHPSDESDGGAPHNTGPHCPLCFFLQGLHALPAPQAPALRLPSARVVMVGRYESPTGNFDIRPTSQPRAPPVSPTV